MPSGRAADARRRDRASDLGAVERIDAHPQLLAPRPRWRARAGTPARARAPRPSAPAATESSRSRISISAPDCRRSSPASGRCRRGRTAANARVTPGLPQHQRRALAARDQFALLIEGAMLEHDDAVLRPRAAVAQLQRPRVSTCTVSPWNSGFGKRTSSQPRLATVVPSVVSPTEMPTIRPSVNALLTMRWPNSVCVAAILLVEVQRPPDCASAPRRTRCPPRSRVRRMRVLEHLPDVKFLEIQSSHLACSPEVSVRQQLYDTPPLGAAAPQAIRAQPWLRTTWLRSGTSASNRISSALRQPWMRIVSPGYTGDVNLTPSERRRAGSCPHTARVSR